MGRLSNSNSGRAGKRTAEDARGAIKAGLEEAIQEEGDLASMTAPKSIYKFPSSAHLNGFRPSKGAIAEYFDVKIELDYEYGKEKLTISGEPANCHMALDFIQKLAKEENFELGIHPDVLESYLVQYSPERDFEKKSENTFRIPQRREERPITSIVQAKGDQVELMEALRGKRDKDDHMLSRPYPYTIALGAAGTGKTYISVACGMMALLRKECDNLVICRPAVEAGENLGFLPGDPLEKLGPYMRPIFDVAEELVGRNEVRSLIDDGHIEVEPFAYMRGRTFKNSFVIADEAQNATSKQMRMIVTRMGVNSQLVICGDRTQSDLTFRPGRNGELVKQRTGLDFILKVVGYDGEAHFANKPLIKTRLYGNAKVVKLNVVLRSLATSIMVDAIEAFDDYEEAQGTKARSNKENSFVSIYDVGMFR